MLFLCVLQIIKPFYNIYNIIYIYIGTKDGYLLTMGIDKTHFSSPWNAKSELVDEDEVNDLNDEPVFIQKLLWMAPQPPSVEGCLFVLLGR